ncbi:MAG: hypothetical protein ACI8SR_003018 [Oceanicoccus sp.]|jgi:hypothetical protein
MNKDQLIVEKQKLEVLREQVERTKTACQSWARLEMEREDGSQRQDASFERHLQSIESDNRQAVSAYEKQKKLVAELDS